MRRPLLIWFAGVGVVCLGVGGVGGFAMGLFVGHWWGQSRSPGRLETSSEVAALETVQPATPNPVQASAPELDERKDEPTPLIRIEPERKIELPKSEIGRDEPNGEADVLDQIAGGTYRRSAGTVAGSEPGDHEPRRVFKAEAKEPSLLLQREPSMRRSPSGVYASSGSGHWIKEVSAEGRFIELEDGSLWEVDVVDRVDSALWLASSDITVVDEAGLSYKLINKDDDEAVSARLIHP